MNALSESRKAFMAAHLEISMPKGARNMPEMPIIKRTASCREILYRPSMSSRLRLPSWYSVEPTDRNRSDFAMAWKTTSIIAAHRDSAVPTPEQATISPRFDMVE